MLNVDYIFFNYNIRFLRQNPVSKFNVTLCKIFNTGNVAV
jgi:hypothetical protein